MKLSYKRLLLKLSGEQLAGSFDGGIDPSIVTWIAKEVKQAQEIGVEVAIMVGGGNFVRGAQIAGYGISRVNADYMGMLGTFINGLALADIFNANGVDTRLLTNIRADQVADQFTNRRAKHHLEKGRVIVVAGGIGRPYLTTDTAAVSLALELNCDVVCKATKVDGVYDRDPAKYPDAKRLEKISFQEAVSNPEINVMDKAAMGLAMEHSKPIVVFDLLKESNIRRVVQVDSVGTIIN